jgi:predicted component of viral defense system (DUF524 family)
MAAEEIVLSIRLQEGIEAKLTVFPESGPSTLCIAQDAEEYGESPYQILEGCSYEYSFEPGSYRLEIISGVVSRSKKYPSTGHITPGIYTGLLAIPVCTAADDLECGQVYFEVRSIKTSYREDYRRMLEDITDKCTSLVMQSNSPVSQLFTQDYSDDPETLYEQFAFIKSLIDTPEFIEGVHRIISDPVTRWKEFEHLVDTRKIGRINNTILKQLISGPNRISLPSDHPLRKNNIDSLPAKVIIADKMETVDTPENRFIKHVLTVFRNFAADIKERLVSGSREYGEASKIEGTLETILQESLFKEVSAPQSLAVSSPVLQRKEGYREVLRVWLMFDVASKLCWKGGDDVYSAGKRNVALLYEYWLFFKLLDLLQETFEIKSDSIEQLIEKTSDGLRLRLKSGKHTPIKGIYDARTRKLNIQFSYNRTFTGENDYPEGGSWTRNMRPDYSLSIWPSEFSEEEAEIQELMVHVHFDAKYKVEHLFDIIGKKSDDPEKEMEEEKLENMKGNYKRADLLKMHAYKDAIRRTSGAYVLYPGSEVYNKTGFHEILPGLGAFPIRPSQTDDGTSELKKFLLDIVQQFINRASQQERTSYQIFDIHKTKDDPRLNETIPERYGGQRVMPPDKIAILVGFCKSEEHYEWIKRNCLYNARMESVRGSIKLEPLMAGAEYLLLHKEGDLISGDLWKITENGPQVFSKDKLIIFSYPEPSQEHYLIYKVSKEIPEELKNVTWDIRKLDAHTGGRGSALPFAVTLKELMEAKVS